MRISKILLSSFLSLSLLAVGTTLVGSDTSVSVEVDGGNHEGAEGSNVSPDTIKAVSWASFLSPSYILEGIPDWSLSPTLRVMDAVQALVEPKSSPSDFWEMAKKSEEKVQEYVHRLLEAAAMSFKSTKFTDITSAMNHIVGATATFRDNIKDALDAHHVTFDALSEELEGIFMVIVNDLEKIPPPDKAPGHAERAKMVDEVLDRTGQALTELASRYGIKEEVVAAYLLALKPQVEVLIVAIGDINEQYPQLLPTLTFSVASLLIPELWILGPFLRIFGFGLADPVKGLAVAWMQRRFWGGAVEGGSWLSLLQAAGLGVMPKWAEPVAKTFIGGVLLPYLNRG